MTLETLPAWAAILISLASLSVGWLLYDNLCKSRLANNPTLLMLPEGATREGGGRAVVGGDEHRA